MLDFEENVSMAKKKKDFACVSSATPKPHIRILNPQTLEAIYQTRQTVFRRDIQTPRSVLTIRCVEEFLMKFEEITSLYFARTF